MTQFSEKNMQYLRNYIRDLAFGVQHAFSSNHSANYLLIDINCISEFECDIKY